MYEVWLWYHIQSCVFIQLSSVSTNTENVKECEVCGVLFSGSSLPVLLMCPSQEIVSCGEVLTVMGFLLVLKVSGYCSNLCSYCFVFFSPRYAPSKRWHIDTIMRVLTTVSEIASV